LPWSARCLVLIGNDTAGAERTWALVHTFSFVYERRRSTGEAYISFLLLTKIAALIALETRIGNRVRARSLGADLIAALFVQVNCVTDGVVARNAVVN
jgi:hypothetical protein